VGRKQQKKNHSHLNHPNESAKNFEHYPTTPVPREFFEKLPWLWKSLSGFPPFALGLAIVSLAVIWWWPRVGLRWLPVSILAMVGAMVFVILNLWSESQGVATIGSRFGSNAIPSSFPALLFPDMSFDLLREPISPATSLALLGAIESLLSAVVADGLAGDRHDSNTE
jgi:SulP family sulfate permease